MIASAILFQACNGEKERTVPDRSVSPEMLAKLPRATFDKGGVKFSMANLDGVFRMPPDSVPWSYNLEETSQNGQIQYYFLEGEPMTMGAAHIRVEYLSKSMPGCESTEKLFSWLKSLYVGNERNGEVLEPGKILETADGQKVELLQIYIPNFTRVEDSVQMAAKTMAWAYLDQGDRYVAMNLTAKEQAKYDRAIPVFKDMVRSYRKE